ncbi:MAG: hypothetical protein LBJ76_02995 [Candidatus Accumulibacter sp.]|nr:hypothetical protein [Accumulibacter sp.]
MIIVTRVSFWLIDTGGDVGSAFSGDCITSFIQISPRQRRFRLVSLQ